MKSILPWLVAAVMLAATVFFFSANRKLSADVATLREESAKVEPLRAEVERLKSSGAPAQAEEIAKLRRDNQDLLRLRNEVRQLRDGNKQLAQQVEQSHAQAQAAQAHLQVLSTNLLAVQTAAQQASAARLVTPPATAQDAVAACINNLRQIDGAMQQWALENKKTASDVPTAKDIAPYLKDGIPKCPAGGTYTPHTVAEEPTCSIPGHAFPAK